MLLLLLRFWREAKRVVYWLLISDYNSQGLYLYPEAWGNPSWSRGDLVRNLPNKIKRKFQDTWTPDSPFVESANKASLTDMSFVRLDKKETIPIQSSLWYNS